MPSSSHPADSEDSDQPSADGLSMLDVLSLAASQRQIVNWLMRHKQATLTEIATQIDQPTTSVQAILNLLVAQGFVQILELNGELYYQPRMARKQHRRVPDNIWQQLDN